MLRSDYDRNLSSLQDDLAAMGERVEAATRSALAALETQDMALAQKNHRQ
jgi:phosphate uptake regulator